MKGIAVLTTTLLLLFSTLAAGRPPVVAETVKATGDHFQVVCHFEDEVLAREALDIVEEVWPRAIELFGAVEEKLKTPLVVNLYRTREEYEAVEQELTQGRFARNLAFSHWGTTTAHVVLQPFLSDEALQVVGLPYQTRRLLTHESVHLARFHTYANFRHHPGWFSNGVASSIDRDIAKSERWIDGSDADPYYSTRALTLQRMITEGRLPKATEIVFGQNLALGFKETYALHHAFVEFLLQGPREKRFKQLARSMLTLPNSDDFKAKLTAQVERMMGKSVLKSLDKDFQGFVQSAEPQWDEINYSLETAGNEWVQAAFPKGDAIAWNTGAPEDDEWSLSGEIEFLPGKKQQMNVLVDRSDSGFVQVSFGPGFGITVFEFDETRDEKWKQLAAKDLARSQFDEPLEFEVRHDKELVVEIGGEALIQLDIEGRSMRGAWGLGALVNTTGIWRSIEFDD